MKCTYKKVRMFVCRREVTVVAALIKLASAALILLSSPALSADPAATPKVICQLPGQDFDPAVEAMLCGKAVPFTDMMPLPGTPLSPSQMKLLESVTCVDPNSLYVVSRQGKIFAVKVVEPTSIVSLDFTDPAVRRAVASATYGRDALLPICKGEFAVVRTEDGFAFARVFDNIQNGKRYLVIEKIPGCATLSEVRASAQLAAECDGFIPAGSALGKGSPALRFLGIGGRAAGWASIPVFAAISGKLDAQCADHVSLPGLPGIPGFSLYCPNLEMANTSPSYPAEALSLLTGGYIGPSIEYNQRQCERAVQIGLYNYQTECALTAWRNGNPLPALCDPHGRPWRLTGRTTPINTCLDDTSLGLQPIWKRVAPGSLQEYLDARCGNGQKMFGADFKYLAPSLRIGRGTTHEGMCR